MKTIQYRRIPYDLAFPAPFSALHREMNRLFENGANESNLEKNPALDVIQTGEQIQVVVELPGYQKDKIELSLQENTLTISGERHSQEPNRTAAESQPETISHRFKRNVRLPVPVDAEKLSAHYQDGLLVVNLPKLPEIQPKKITVNIA